MTSTPPRKVTCSAYPRVGLLGNPADQYGGHAIAFSFSDFQAEVTLAEADEDSVDARGGLLGALLRRFEAQHLKAKRPPLRMHFESDIPRQVGLAGSSAIIVAGLRALMGWFDVSIAPHEQAQLALDTEVIDLEITAGPLDRIIQVYEGVQYMSCELPLRADGVRAIAPERLPPLFVAYDPSPGESSGVIHAPLRARWERGDTDVVEAVNRLHEIAQQGLTCLQRGHVSGFMGLMDRNFDTRASISQISERNLAMVALGREYGAATKFCGSGGAVVGVVEDEARLPRLQTEYRRAGFEFLRPTLQTARSQAA